MAASLYHRQIGAAVGVPVIAMHGLFGSLENLGLVTRQLSEDFTVYSLDLPNHGRSAHTDEISLSSMAEDVVAWMIDNNIIHAHLLGHSLGGKVAMEIALRYPERVVSLIVADIAPVAYTHCHEDVFAAFRAVDLEAIHSRMDADQAMSAHIEELSIRSFLLKNLEKNASRWFWRMNLEGLIAAYDKLVDANTQMQQPFLGKVLFIKGELSSYILPEHKQAILDLFPHASVKVINGTHHWLHAEKPYIFSDIAKRFFLAD